MSSVRERTQKEIVDYIRTHSKNGKLTKSLLDIARDIGYSNATIHRALTALQDAGIVDIVPSKRPTEPNTIVYKGEENQFDEFLTRGVQLSEEVENLGKRIQEFMNDMSWLLRNIEASQHELLPGEIIHIQDIPNSDLQNVLIRKPME